MRIRRSSFSALLMMLLIAALGSLILAGCGSSDKDSKTTTPPMTSSTSTSEDTTSTADTTSTSEDTNTKPDGAMLFTNNCQSCHGQMGTGGHVGPDLQKSTVSDDQKAVAAQIANGGGQMPAFKDILSQPEIDALAAYVHDEIAQKG